MALNPLSSSVKLATIIRGAEIELINPFKVKSKNTPAVTRVDECTKEETGVGAAIASGNHLTQGNKALFVIAASNTNHTKISNTSFDSVKYSIFSNPAPRSAIVITKITKNTSPTRLVTTVIYLLVLPEE